MLEMKDQIARIKRILVWTLTGFLVCTVVFGTFVGNAAKDMESHILGLERNRTVMLSGVYDSADLSSNLLESQRDFLLKAVQEAPNADAAYNVLLQSGVLSDATPQALRNVQSSLVSFEKSETFLNMSWESYQRFLNQVGIGTLARVQGYPKIDAPTLVKNVQADQALQTGHTNFR